MKKVLFGSLALLTAAAMTLPAAPASADSVGGPHHLTGGRIAPGEVHRFTFTFYGDELAEVVASGDGDIDLRVIDGAGEVVAEDREPDGVPVCIWTPSFTRTYTIEVRNAARYMVDYELRTN